MQSRFLTGDTPPARGDDDTGDTGDTRYVQTPSGSLNLREKARSDARILTTIPKGAAVRVLEAGTAWCRVRYGDVTGYVVTRYLTGKASEATPPPAPPIDTPAPQNGEEPVTPAPTDTPAPTAIYDITMRDAQGWAAAVSGDVDEVRMRAWCAEDAPPVRTLRPGDSVTLRRMGDEWCLVESGGQEGYVPTAALALWQEEGP